jgi:integrase
LIALTSACLGLRVSETLGLQWSDIDWKLGIVTIRRSAYRGSINETKNPSSKARLPLHPTLAELLLAWKLKSETANAREIARVTDTDFGSEWLFANPEMGIP